MQKLDFFKKDMGIKGLLGEIVGGVEQRGSLW
jgi:hypothetical protein